MKIILSPPYSNRIVSAIKAASKVVTTSRDDYVMSAIARAISLGAVVELEPCDLNRLWDLGGLE